MRSRRHLRAPRFLLHARSSKTWPLNLPGPPAARYAMRQALWSATPADKPCGFGTLGLPAQRAAHPSGSGNAANAILSRVPAADKRKSRCFAQAPCCSAKKADRSSAATKMPESSALLRSWLTPCNTLFPRKNGSPSML